MAPMTAEEKWAQLQAEHPPLSKPKGLYRPVVIAGNLAYTSGHLPALPDGTVQTGRVGVDADETGGRAAARRATLALLASLRAELGNLNRVRRVIKVLGMVQCTPDFQGQPAVVNGASELLADVFGADAGVGARCAFGAHSLPMGALVEIEAVFEIR